MSGPNRELLELAAFQVGLKRAEYYYFKPAGPGLGGEWPAAECITHYVDGDPTVKAWCPLNDDGQCARMEADQMLSIRWQKDRVQVFSDGFRRFEFYRDHEFDRMKARRRASVRVVATMGAYRDRDRKVSPEILE